MSVDSSHACVGCRWLGVGWSVDVIGGNAYDNGHAYVGGVAVVGAVVVMMTMINVIG